MLCLSASIASADNGFDLWRGNHRFSYEILELPRDENLGLAGYHYLVDLPYLLYAGVGLYGAVAGHRGGFFTGGFEAGVRPHLTEPLFFEAGLFVGGGGGGSAAQGGGLMIRPHLGLIWAFRAMHIGLEYAHVEFPNGEISSDHAALLLEFPFMDLRIRPGHRDDVQDVLGRAFAAAGRGLRPERERFIARYQVYTPHHRATDVGGGTATGTFQTAGFEYQWDLGGTSYLFVEASGAAGGSSDGYAEVLAGGGVRVPLVADMVLLDSRISLGAAGGGGVDTAGGGLAKASLGLTFPAGDALSFDARAGYVLSAGSFRARTLELGLGYAFDALSLGAAGADRPEVPDRLRTVLWRTRLSVLRYTSLDADMRKDREHGGLSLIGAKVDLFPADGPFYLTGQAQTAIAGGAGGYAAGLMGIGYLSGPLAGTGLHLFAELLGGAAGGGGIDVGGGGLIQPAVGMVADISDSWGIELSAGRIRAVHGELDSTVAGLSLVHRFATAAGKAGRRDVPGGISSP